MSEAKRIGLKLVMWVASVLLKQELTYQQREDLNTLRTTISVAEFDKPEDDE